MLPDETLGSCGENFLVDIHDKLKEALNELKRLLGWIRESWPGSLGFCSLDLSKTTGPINIYEFMFNCSKLSYADFSQMATEKNPDKEFPSKTPEEVQYIKDGVIKDNSDRETLFKALGNSYKDWAKDYGCTTESMEALKPDGKSTYGQTKDGRVLNSSPFGIARQLLNSAIVEADYARSVGILVMSVGLGHPDDAPLSFFGPLQKFLNGEHHKSYVLKRLALDPEGLNEEKLGVPEFEFVGIPNYAEISNDAAGALAGQYVSALTPVLVKQSFQEASKRTIRQIY
jgi:hypothetical protein